MKSLVKFISNTVVGGALFLVPMIILLAILGKAQQIASKIVAPLQRLIPESTLGAELAIRLLAITLLVLVCFLAGVISRKRSAQKAATWLEENILIHVPGYSLIKSITSSAAGVQSDSHAKPVLARIEDAWQLGFIIETLEADHLAVYVPGAPNAMSGSIYFMGQDRVRPVDLPVPKVMKLMRQLGVGSNALLKGQSLSGFEA